MLLLLLRLCCWLAALAALAPIALAAPTGKLAPERKDKEEWENFKSQGSRFYIFC